MLSIAEKLTWAQLSIDYIWSEILLSVGIILLLLFGFFKKNHYIIVNVLTLFLFLFVFIANLLDINTYPRVVSLFSGMLQYDAFSTYLKLIFDASGVLTVLLSWSIIRYKQTEYYILIVAVVLGAHLLVMSSHFVMVLLSIELISIPSYILAAFVFNKKSIEGSLKYFLYGSVASAIMIYGISLFYGITQTLDFSSELFVQNILRNQSTFLFIAGCFVFSGFLYKIGSTPMHVWIPDVYEASPTPIVVFFSVVPKLAGVGILTKFCLILNLSGQTHIQWNIIIAIVATLTLIVGNLAALLQKNPKRMMGYSSVAQAGFLLIGLTNISQQGMSFMLFYATIFSISNFLIFLYIQYFEKYNIQSIESYTGIGYNFPLASILLLLGLLSLVGLPPVAGFMSKFFVFSGLWNAYESSGKNTLLWLFIVGLISTVISLFFYLKIPYQSFLKTSEKTFINKKRSVLEVVIGLILALLLVVLFFWPQWLMAWLNRILMV